MFIITIHRNGAQRILPPQQAHLDLLAVVADPLVTAAAEAVVAVGRCIVRYEKKSKAYRA